MKAKSRSSLPLGEHWQDVYTTRPPEERSWHTQHLDLSLQWIKDARVDTEASILDAGAGDSTFVDDLLVAGYREITLVELSPAALQRSRSRLGAAAEGVRWIEGDVTVVGLQPGYYDVWHDRAVFHFLAGEARARYVEQVLRSCKPGALVLIATFGPDGPAACSGLPTQTYSSATLSEALGAEFTLLRAALALHQTPWGSSQEFIHCLFQIRTTASFEKEL